MNRNKKMKGCLLLLASLCLISFAGCNNINRQENESAPITKEAFKLNTIIQISIYDSKDESILDGAMAICDKYEQIYSRTLETSELYRLNHRQLPNPSDNKDSFMVSKELADILEDGLYYSNISGGAFDITVEPITSLWDFTSGEAIVPDKKAIQKAVSETGYQNMILDGNIVTLKKDSTGIDLGAIAKGYIADRIKEYLLDQGVKSAIINLGGNVLTVGEKPNGEPFKVGIQKPFADRNEVAAFMEIEDLSVVSSGVYERYFKKDGVLYHHIIDPTTGYPYDNGLISVTIISPKSVEGDGLSTSCFALGLDKGMELINSLDDIYAIFITKDYVLHYSDGFRENITVTEVK
jgi:thiamine biosynthesis lipoprotein